MKYVAIQSVSLAFIVAATVIAASGHDGWGWCIFGAICTHMSWRDRSGDEPQNPDA